jgi:hypothetical protein
MNYGEELGYWYLRLNGFFPVSNYVIHRSQYVHHRSDYDLIAVRPPFVYEEIGGKPDDWDEYLSTKLDFTQHIGLLCEVKTGQLEKDKLFRSRYLKTGVERLGLFPMDDTQEILDSLSTESGYPSGNVPKVIGKLFISPREHKSDKYLNRSVEQVEDFILTRVEKFLDEKFASRMFFPSQIFQLLIAQVNKRRG